MRSDLIGVGCLLEKVVNMSLLLFWGELLMNISIFVLMIEL